MATGGTDAIVRLWKMDHLEILLVDVAPESIELKAHEGMVSLNIRGNQ